MRISLLSRYILQEIAPNFLVNILVFTSIMLMAQIMKLTSLVVSKGVSPWVVIEMLVLLTPKVLSLTLPMATLLAVLTTFLRLSADSELTVLRASGLSLYQLAPPVLAFGTVVALLTGAFSLWLTPEANWRFKERLLDLAKARADLAIVEQTFIRNFAGLTLYIGQLPPGSNLMGQVFIHDSRNPAESAVIVAQRGRLGLDREAGILLLNLEDGVIDRVYPGRQNTDSIFFDTYELKISPGTEVDREREGGALRGRSELPTSQLRLQSLNAQKPADQVRLLLEWQRRWSLPFSAFIMALIGLPLGASFRVRGRNFALIMGLGVFITYYAITSVGWSLAEARLLPPWIAAWMANIILATLGVILFRRINLGVPMDPLEALRRFLHGSGKTKTSSTTETKAEP